MKKTKIIIAAAALLASSSALATSAGSSYVGGQIGQLTYDESGVPDAEPTIGVLRLGHFVVDHFAIEGRLGTSLADDDVRVLGVDVDVEIDYLAGVYGAGYLPLGDSPVSVYGLAGFTRGKATAKAGNISESETDSDFSYGVGLQANMTPQLSGTLEYMSYMDKSDFEASAVTLGLNFNF